MPVPTTVVVLDAVRADGIARCVEALLRHTDDGVPLLVGGDQQAALEAAKLLDAAGRRHDRTAGTGGALIAEVHSAHPHEHVAYISGDTEVTAGWVDSLVSAAGDDAQVASVTPLSNAAAFLTVPKRNLPWPTLGIETPDGAAAALRDAGEPLLPRIPCALAHCVLLTAGALDLVGPPPTDQPDRGEALAAWSANATGRGLVHVAADGLYVGHRPEPEPWGLGEWPRDAGQAMLSAVTEAAEDRHSALSRSLLRAAVTLEPLAVTVDARCLGGDQLTGTSLHVIELLGAISAREDLRVRALVPDRLGAPAQAALPRMARLELCAESDQRAAPARTHVVHRPWQVDSVSALSELDDAGERLVITHQDLIAYRMPAVFETPESWLDHRTTTRDALAMASAVVCFSRAVADDLAADDLVAEGRCQIVPIGTDPRFVEPAAPECPPAVDGERPFLVLLGTRFRHKNALFALHVLRELREGHGWDGELVIAGAEVLNGTGSAEDAEWLVHNREHAGEVRIIGAVTEGEKAWLLSEAAAVMFPSTYEGFGLVPAEAAAAGVPCAFAPVSAMQTLLPADAALMVPWDASATAARLAPVLAPGPARDEAVAGLVRACAPYTWDRTAESLARVYRAAVELPAPPAARVRDDLAIAERRYWQVRDSVGPALWQLVDPDGPLVDEQFAGRLASGLRDARARARIERVLKRIR